MQGENQPIGAGAVAAPVVAPDSTRLSLTLTPRAKRAIVALATLEKIDYAAVLDTRTIPQAVAEYDKLKSLFAE